MSAQATNMETESNYVATNANNNLSVENNDRNIAPDGGWGWTVVIGAFMVYAVAHGFMASFGVFVEDFVNYFESSKSAVGGIASLMLGVELGSGSTR